MTFKINAICNMDCLKGMKGMNDKCVDISITSPPYNLGSDKYESYDDNRGDYREFIINVINEMIRVTKHYSFFNFQMLKDNQLVYLEIMHRFRYNIKDIIIWHKKRPVNCSPKECLTPLYEFILVLCERYKTSSKKYEYSFFNNEDIGNVIHGHSSTATKEMETNRGTNKATFPLYIPLWFINKFTKVGDLVFDPFTGSGTTALACKQTDRNFFGYEIDYEQCVHARERLSQTRINKFGLSNYT